MRLLVYTLLLPLALCTLGKVCFEAASGNKTTDFDGIVHFFLGRVASSHRPGLHSIVKGSSGTTFVIRKRRILEWAVVPSTPTPVTVRNVKFCRRSAEDRVGTSDMATCVPVNGTETLRFIPTVRVRGSTCDGFYIALQKGQVRPIQFFNAAYLYKRIEKYSVVEGIRFREAVVTGSVFAALGASLAYLLIGFVYSTFKIRLTRALVKKLDQSKATPPSTPPPPQRLLQPQPAPSKSQLTQPPDLAVAPETPAITASELAAAAGILAENAADVGTADMTSSDLEMSRLLSKERVKLMIHKPSEDKGNKKSAPPAQPKNLEKKDEI